MKLTFKYPVYPTRTQQTTLLTWLDHLCELQNSARHDRKVAWETEGQSISCNEQQKKLTIAREKYSDFREVPQDMQVCALERMDKAFDGFYQRCKNGAAKKGYPRHRKQIKSMTWKLRKYTKVVRRKTKDTEKQTIRVRENPIRETAWKHDRLKVPKLGEVKIYMHRPFKVIQHKSRSSKKHLVGMLRLPASCQIPLKLNQQLRSLLTLVPRTI